MDDALHPVQKDILEQLLFSKHGRFSDLNLRKLSNDHFSFHIKKLQIENLILKNEDGNYELTVAGKAFVTQMNFSSKKREGRQKVIALVVAAKQIDGETKYLIHKRKRQPYFDYYGLTTIRVPRGYGILEFAKSQFKEKTGLDGDLIPIGIEHKMDYSTSDHELLEDNLFIVYKLENYKGEFKERLPDGENIWMTLDEVLKLPYVFGNLERAIAYSKKQGFTFEENVYEVDVF